MGHIVPLWVLVRAAMFVLVLFRDRIEHRSRL